VPFIRIQHTSSAEMSLMGTVRDQFMEPRRSLGCDLRVDWHSAAGQRLRKLAVALHFELRLRRVEPVGALEMAESPRHVIVEIDEERFAGSSVWHRRWSELGIQLLHNIIINGSNSSSVTAVLPPPGQRC